ncbi:hypothetical protein HYW73_02520 [Candidatus Nomurabacteria bacterium]|nr:hypothetical protein [Candidatus Nomurabacteria bacterium]
MNENTDISKDAEINQALQEFEAKNTEEAAQNAPVVSKNYERLGLVGWVVKHSGGVIKDEAIAEYALLAFAAVATVISLFLFFGGNGQQFKKGMEVEIGPELNQVSR